MEGVFLLAGCPVTGGKFVRNEPANSPPAKIIMETLSQLAQSVFGLHLAPAQEKAFDVFAAELLEWNARMNLTAITDAEGIRVKHFLDSLSVLTVLHPAPGERVVDVGTGAGFPGLALKIAQPTLRMTLVEATGKKADFCRHVVDCLKLRDVEVLHARAEDVGQEPPYREAFDWAVARAVADLSVLAEYLLPLVKVGGHAIAQKGEAGPAEAHAAASAFQMLGGSLEKIVPIELPGIVETRYLVLLAKNAGTPARYPRRAGLAAKQPLEKPHSGK